MQYCSYSIRACFHHVTSTTGCPGLQGSVFALQESISQSCVSSGSSIVGLMVTSSERAFPYPGLLHPKLLSLWQSTADLYLHKRHSNTVLSQSLWGPWVLVCTRFVWVLLASLMGVRLIVNVNSPFLPSFWGFSFALGHGVSPHSCSSAYHLTGVSLTLNVGYLLMARPVKLSCHSWPLT